MKAGVPRAFISMPSRCPFQTFTCNPPGDIRCCVVLIPGNPGFVNLYAAFAAVLSAGLQAHVIIVGYAGHVSRSTAGYSSFARAPSLEEQVAHFSDQVFPIADDALDKKLPLVVVGHSIGGWIAIQVARALGRANRVPSFVIALMPFLQNNYDVRSFEAKRRLLTYAPFLIPMTCMLAALIARAPRWLMDKFVLRSAPPGADTPTRAIIRDELLCYGGINNYLGLARTEFERLRDPFDWEMAAKASGDLRLLYTPDDEWAPVALIERARAAGLQADLLHGVSHAFVTVPSDTELVATWVIQQVTQRLQYARLSEERPC